jgi:hypothetical protein
MRNDMVVFAEPAMPCHFKQVRALSRVRHKNPSEKISRVRSDVLGKCERSRGDVLVKQVDVVAFWIGGIVIEREISR